MNLFGIFTIKDPFKRKEEFEKIKQTINNNLKPIVDNNQKNVNNLIRDKYTLDEEFALINNYNLYKNDSSNGLYFKYKEEYDVYQNYRKNCKDLVKK